MSKGIEDAATESGFSLDDAIGLAWRLVRDEPPFLAEWRQDGAVQALDGETIEELLVAIEDWATHRARMGIGAAA